MISIDEDIKIPFTCQVTGEYCKGQINTLSFELENKFLFIIPISDMVVGKINKRFSNKIKKFVLKELKEICQKKKK